ncbi:hypothetical protein ST201phi2-1p171 [Pseudomonas phage 201phi2-1]|uniref:Uncharacterized protein n=1 Tax=Pseudomonas phage 201phi2-1 TaxID=198110 RepID=B3FJ34_BP201|nr:hypothetical protein ST201phi2-1p171 [Pseudomonas phage 201phi2-1]ABY63001.1 hypothetical protein 201phi2-1p171 [Pseudomonas phage 201phi2-1]
MFGSLLKYTCVAACGALVFSTMGHFMDSDVIESAKATCEENVKALSGEAEGDELALLMKAFVATHYKNWVSQLTFAGSVKDLDAVLAPWA